MGVEAACLLVDGEQLLASGDLLGSCMILTNKIHVYKTEKIAITRWSGESQSHRHSRSEKEHAISVTCNSKGSR